MSIRTVLIRVIRSEIVIVSLILIGAIAFFYRDVVFGGHTFLLEGANDRSGEGLPTFYSRPYLYRGPTDSFVLDSAAIGHEMDPWDQFIATTFHYGQIPLWNPHQGLGTPLYANGNSGIFDPIHWLVYLAPLKLWSLAMDVHLLVRYFLAGLFTFLFMRALHLHFMSALAAAFVFMFSSHFTFYGNISFIRVETLLPMVMYTYHRLAARRTLGAVLLTAISIYLMIVADFPELLILLIGLGLLWYLIQCLLIVGMVRNKLQLFTSMLGLAFVATFVGFLLGAHVLLPFAQFLANGSHLHSSSDMASFMGILPTYQMLGYLIPVMPSQTQMGIISVMLVISGLFIGFQNYKVAGVKRLFRYALFFIMFALFLNFVTYRVPGFDLINRLPILNMIYLYRYAQVPIIFCFACCAGIGMELFFSIKLEHRLPMINLALILTFMLVLIGVNIESSNLGILLSQILLSLIASIALILLLLIALRKITDVTHSFRIANVLIVFLLFIGPAIFNNSLHERPLRNDPYVESPYMTFLQHIGKPYRIIGTNGILEPNITSAYAIDDIRYEDAINPPVWHNFRQQFLDTSNVVNFASGFRLEDASRFNTVITPPLFNHAMDMLNVQYVLSTSPTPPISAYGDAAQFSEVYNWAHVFVYRNNNAFPRAYIVHTAEIITGEQAIFDRFASKIYDPSRAVILDEAPPPAFMRTLPIDSSPYQPATIIAENMNDTTVQARLDQPGFLVLSELAYPGWEATVDGQPAKIYNAYGFMRAVALIAGNHVIAFRFRPTLFFVGLGAAFLTLLTLIGLGLMLRVRHKRASSLSIATN